MNFFFRSGIIGMCLVIGACAYTSMDAKIAPDVMVPESTVGHGQTVGVVVVDERPNSDIGKRAPMGAKIKMAEDLAAIYQAALMEGLSRKGFKPAPGAVDGPTLKVEIRALSYETSVGWWTGGIETDSAVKAFAVGTTEPYERLYRANDADRTAVVPGAKKNNARLNAIVTSTLRQLLDDQKLLEVLAAAE